MIKDSRITIKQAMDRLRKAVKENPEYAWGWQSNIAMAFFDEGMSLEKANRAAAKFMKNAFDVDMTKNPMWNTLWKWEEKNA